MADPVVLQVEQAAGIAAAKTDLDSAVPEMFRGYIHDDLIASIVYDVLMAGAKARVLQSTTVRAVRPITPTK